MGRSHCFLVLQLWLSVIYILHRLYILFVEVNIANILFQNILLEKWNICV